MRRMMQWRRTIATVVFSLSTMVSAVVPLADAYAERESTAARSHVETPGSSRCPQVHSENACQLCRVVRLLVTGPSHGDAIVELLVPEIVPPGEPVALPVARVAPSTSPRAPPSV